ncbi:hypothetical protein ACTG9Q_03130 [Actinokineospora sp. 24-640]
MDEHELRHAMNQAMAHTPPPMDPAETLSLAQAAHRRRRNALMGGGAAAGVAVIAAGAIALAGAMGGPAAQPGSALSSTVQVTPSAAPVPSSPVSTLPGSDVPTKPSWPNGQTDRTASQGPQHARGAELLDLMTAALPAHLQSPPLEWTNPAESHGETRYHQAQYADTINGVEVWEYMAGMPVGANGRYGKLLMEVHTAGNNDPASPCALAKNFWGMGGKCEVRNVNGKKVGVVSQPTDDNRFDQWAAYRHADGTTVYAAQTRTYEGISNPPLLKQPLTLDQLAELVTTDRFALS